MNYGIGFADYRCIIASLIGFSKPSASHSVPPTTIGHFVPLSFTAYCGKIQNTRCAGGRWPIYAYVKGDKDDTYC